MPTVADIALVVLAEHLALSHVAAHRRQAAQHVADHLAVAGREQVGEVVDRDPHRSIAGKTWSGSAS